MIENVIGAFELPLGVAGNFCAAIIYLFDNYHGKRKETIEAELAEMRARRQLVDERSEDVEAVIE